MDNMYYYRYWMREAAMWRYFWKHNLGGHNQFCYREMMGAYQQAMFFKRGA